MSTSRSSEPASGAPQHMEVREVSIDSIVPYWRNPRRISAEAVEAVVHSIQRYGYQQPIVVDSENVVIAGHTRLSAMRRMKAETIPVIVATDLSPEQVKQLRAIDNRTAELTSWDYDKLAEELGMLDSDLRTAFFPDVAGDAEDSRVQDSGDGVLDLDLSPREEGGIAEFVCPSCFHMWEQQVTVEDVRKGLIQMNEEVSAS